MTNPEITNLVFEKNLQHFALKNPKGSTLLAFVDPGSLCVARDAEKNPILRDGNFYYHSAQSARDEAQEWVHSLKLDGVEYIAVFGVGMGYGYYALKTWLEGDSSRRLIFLEDDLRVLLLFLESTEACDLLDNPQVHLYYTEDSQDGLEVLQNIAWSAYGKNMLITCMPFYEAYRKKTFDDITARLQYETSDIHIVLDEYMTHGVSFFKNFWKNLFLLPGSYKGNKLQGAFKGIPAIVVAAGPSLEQHLAELKDLRDRALIFSGGSSVNALLDAQILPHFGAGIDPNPTQYLRFRQALAFQVPFFYRNRLLRESAELIQGPRLYLKGGDGYNISDWFEKKCKIPGSIIGGGHSVANFIIEIAHSLGCSPIILVGYDLSYGKNQQLYAPGVEDRQVTAARDESEPITWQDKAGKKIKTAWKWLLEAKWIEDFAKSKPRPKLINATEGGLGLQNIPDMSLKEVSQKYLTVARDLDSLVHTAIQDAGIIDDNAKAILQGCSQMYDSLERAKEYLEAVAQTLKATNNINDSSGILQLAELKEEIAYQYILEVFDKMRIKLEHYRLQFKAHPQIDNKTMQAYEVELLLERYKFLYETAEINQLLIVQSIENEKSKGRDVSLFCPKLGRVC